MHIWQSYLLGGSCLLPRLRNLLRATGSQSLTVSFDGGGTSSDDEDSTSRGAWDEALRRNTGEVAQRVFLASLHKTLAVR